MWLHDYVPRRGGCLQKSKVAKRFRVRDSQKTSLCGKGQHGNLFGRCASLKSLVFKKDTLGHFITFFCMFGVRGSKGLIPRNNLRFWFQIILFMVWNKYHISCDVLECATTRTYSIKFTIIQFLEHYALYRTCLRETPPPCSDFYACSHRHHL